MVDGPKDGPPRAEIDPAALLAALPDMVVAVDATGTITWASHTFAPSLGWTREDLIGRSMFDLFAKRSNRNLHLQALASAIATPGLRGPSEVTVVAADGRLRELELMLNNKLDDPAIGAMIAIGRDITDRDQEAEGIRQRDAWAASVLRGAPELVVVTDRNGDIVYLSPSVARLLGFAYEDLVGLHLTEIVHPGDLLAPARDNLSLDQILGTGPGRRRQLRLKRYDGSWNPMQVERSLHDDLGEHSLIFTARQVEAEDAVADLLSEQSVVLERIARGASVQASLHAVANLLARRVADSDVVIGYFEDGEFRSESPEVDPHLMVVLDRTAISRPPSAPPVSLAPRLFSEPAWDAVLEQASDGAYHRVWGVDLVQGDAPTGRISILRRSDAELTPEDLSVVGIAVDLATIAVERHHLQSRLAHGSLHDPLTGLPNRRFLLARLSDAFAVHGANVGLLFVDIDRFKLINDSLGHEAGDQLLREVAARFSRALRPSDLVARVGGDEFVAMCPDLDSEEAVAVLASRLTDALATPVDLPGGRIVVSASIGVAHAVGPADPASALQDADLAMYDAKERGRNRTAVFHAGLREKAIARLETENALREALRADEMRLHFQPVIRLRDNRMVGVEALLRWDRPGYGVVMPNAFVPVATDTGLILPLGRWVIEQACRAAKRWPDLEVAANLSARQLADADLVDFVADCLSRHRVAKGHLCLEVTEADLVTDPDLVVEQLRRFKELGVRLAIDDFGTGFATLDYLRRFSAADVLKVDASFVAGLGDPAKHDLAIVSAALVLADNLGFDTVAEGVETEAQRQVLQRLGCELAQGHLFSRSVAPEEIDAILASGAVVAPTSGRSASVVHPGGV